MHRWQTLRSSHDAPQLPRIPSRGKPCAGKGKELSGILAEVQTALKYTPLKWSNSTGLEISYILYII